MSTYNINYNFERCTDKGSDKTFVNDGSMWCHVKAEAVNGCTFKEEDTDCKIEMFYNNRWMPIYMNLKKVTPDEDQLILNGEKSGITSDGTFLHISFAFTSRYMGDADCYVKASLGTPKPVPTLNVTNNVAHTTYKKRTSGSNTVITLICDTGYTFDGVPTVTYGGDPDDPFAEASTADMTVSGDIATFSLATDSYGGSATLNGNTKPKPVKPVSVTNNVSHTTYKTEVQGINTKITLTCDGGYTFEGVPRITYGQSEHAYMTVSGNVATFTLATVSYNGVAILEGKTKTVVVINNVAHTTYKKEVQGKNTVITLTCDDGYTFDGVPRITYGQSVHTDMTVSGNVATFSLATDSYGGSCILEGKTRAVAPPVQPVSVTNNVAHTTYQKEVQGDNTVITLTCDSGYTFDGTPTVTYGADPEDPFAEGTTENMTVSGNVATFTLATASYGGFAKLDGNTKEVIPELQNNISGATYTTEEDPFTEVTTVTITCNDGLVFDGVPTVKYVKTSGQQTILAATLNETNTVATAEISDLKYIVSLDGNTKTKPVVPTEPTVTNNVPDSTESHTADGHSVTVNLSSNNVMLNVSCAYVATDGSSKNVPVTVKVVVKPLVDSSNVTSNASVTLPDVDFNSPVVISGESKKALRIDYYLSGCSTATQPTYCFVGEPITFTLNADSGNEFDEPDKCKLIGYSVFAPVYTSPMEISEDKLTATGTITPTVGTSQRDDFYIEVHGVANPQSTPTKKYGFINAYVLNEKNLEDFANARFVPYTGEVGSTKEDPISYDLGDYINRVKRFFFQVDKGSSSKLMCGNFMVDTTVYNLTSDSKVLSFGSVEIPNVTQSTADYDTELNMFVPFIGLESLPVDLIGHTVSLELRVNLLGGGGVYVMTCDDRIVWTKEVEPCSDVLFRTQKQQIQVIGGSKFDSTYLMGLTPYIVLQKKTITSTGVETPSSRLTKVKDVSGFTKMVNVKFADTTNMLTDDVNTIINILRNGFTL